MERFARGAVAGLDSQAVHQGGIERSEAGEIQAGRQFALGDAAPQALLDGFPAAGAKTAQIILDGLIGGRAIDRRLHEHAAAGRAGFAESFHGGVQQGLDGAARLRVLGHLRRPRRCIMEAS